MISNLNKYEYSNSIEDFFSKEITKHLNKNEYVPIDFFVMKLKTLLYKIEKFLFSFGENINLILIINPRSGYQIRLVVPDGLDKKFLNILETTSFLKFGSNINLNMLSYLFHDEEIAHYFYKTCHYNDIFLSGLEYFSKIREVLKYELKRLEALKKILCEQFYIIDTESFYDIETENYYHKVLFLIESSEATIYAEKMNLLEKVDKAIDKN